MDAARRCPRCHQPLPAPPPEWQERIAREGLITMTEAARLLGYTGRNADAGVASAIKRGTLRAVDAGTIYQHERGRRRRLVYRSEVEAMRARREQKLRRGLAALDT